MQRDRLSGIWVPLPTPFAADALALERLPAIVEWLLARGIRGFLALGTTGEAPHPAARVATSPTARLGFCPPSYSPLKR